MKVPKNDARYAWTHHAIAKMQQYGIGEGRVKRIIRFPKRTEEGIAAPDTVAMMQPAGTKRYQELWVMYRLTKPEKKGAKPQFLIITTWRYPGESPARNPVPKEIMDEVLTLL
ncbi:MAG: hypothetical protein HYU81_00030 [Candidatus Brennerbacteria bacterium]|nr:hypothetical protein [Candidatus Brennerbacteria bacterium]